MPKAQLTSDQLREKFVGQKRQQKGLLSFVGLFSSVAIGSLGVLTVASHFFNSPTAKGSNPSSPHVKTFQANKEVMATDPTTYLQVGSFSTMERANAAKMTEEKEDLLVAKKKVNGQTFYVLVINGDTKQEQVCDNCFKVPANQLSFTAQ